MIVKPTVTELLKKAENRYELVIATSKRAREIATGDEPLTKVKEESPVTLAANEIAEGKVQVISGSDEGDVLASNEEEILDVATKTEDTSDKEDKE